MLDVQKQNSNLEFQNLLKEIEKNNQKIKKFEQQISTGQKNLSNCKQNKFFAVKWINRLTSYLFGKRIFVSEKENKLIADIETHKSTVKQIKKDNSSKTDELNFKKQKKIKLEDSYTKLIEKIQNCADKLSNLNTKETDFINKLCLLKVKEKEINQTKSVITNSLKNNEIEKNKIEENFKENEQFYDSYSDHFKNEKQELLAIIQGLKEGLEQLKESILKNIRVQ